MGQHPAIENLMSVLSGFEQQSANNLEFAAVVDSTVTTDADRAKFKEGSCVSINATGGLTLGVGTAVRMPMFLLAGLLEFQSRNYGGDPAVDTWSWVSGFPEGGPNAGNMPLIVATGGYEIRSAQFVSASYSRNATLTSDVSGGDAGKLKAGTLYTDTIVGLVSRGVEDNGYGVSALSFWSVFIPPTV